MPPEQWSILSSCIPDSLIARSYDPTTEQQFYAGGHLMGFELLDSAADCSVELAWTTASGTGSVAKP